MSIRCRLQEADFNIAQACCNRWARETPTAVAIRPEHENGRADTRTYAELQREANRLSNVLLKLGGRWLLQEAAWNHSE